MLAGWISLVPKLPLGNAALEAPASPLGSVASWSLRAGFPSWRLGTRIISLPLLAGEGWGEGDIKRISIISVQTSRTRPTTMCWNWRSRAMPTPSSRRMSVTFDAANYVFPDHGYSNHTTGYRSFTVTTLTLELPDPLFHELEQVASHRHISTENLLLEIARHNLREIRAERYFRERGARGDPQHGLALLEGIARRGDSHGG